MIPIDNPRYLNLVAMAHLSSLQAHELDPDVEAFRLAQLCALRTMQRSEREPSHYELQMKCTMQALRNGDRDTQDIARMTLTSLRNESFGSRLSSPTKMARISGPKLGISLDTTQGHEAHVTPPIAIFDAVTQEEVEPSVTRAFDDLQLADPQLEDETLHESVQQALIRSGPRERIAPYASLFAC